MTEHVITNPDLDIENAGSISGYEPPYRVNLNILALDRLSMEVLSKIRNHLSGLSSHLHDGVQIHFLSFEEVQTADISDFVFILTSSSTASFNLQNLESQLNLKDHCHLLLVIPVDDENFVFDPPCQSLPKGYRSVHIQRNSGAQHLSREETISSLLTSTFVSLFGLGAVCIDPIDFSALCASFKKINYHRFDHTSVVENFYHLRKLVVQLSGPTGIYMCINEASDITPINIWMTYFDEILSAIPEMEFGLISIPDYYYSTEGSMKLDVFIGLN